MWLILYIVLTTSCPLHQYIYILRQIHGWISSMNKQYWHNMEIEYIQYINIHSSKIHYLIHIWTTINIRGKMVHLLDLTRTRYWYEVVWWYLGSLSNIACEPWVEHFRCGKGTRLCVGHAPFPKTNSSTISRVVSHKVAINRFLLHMFFAKVLDLHVISSI